jgi:hypothetical protein
MEASLSRLMKRISGAKLAARMLLGFAMRRLHSCTRRERQVMNEGSHPSCVMRDSSAFRLARMLPVFPSY